MTKFVTIVCLANSKKPGGRCVAGVSLPGGDWVRPVGDREHGELLPREIRLPDGQEPKLLDVIRVPAQGAVTHAYQRENVLIDGTTPWDRDGRLTRAEAAELVSPAAPLWLDDCTDSTYGVNDRVRETAAPQLPDTLRLIRVDALSVRVGAEDPRYPSKVRGEFRHLGAVYGLKVSDPIAAQQFLDQGDGTYEVGPCLLTISLAEPLHGYCCKVIAAIIEPEGEGAP